MKSTAKSNWRSTLPLFLIPIMTSACVHASTPPIASNSFCAIAKPIFYDSRADSANTVKQVEAHNRTVICLCENDCPKPAK